MNRLFGRRSVALAGAVILAGLGTFALMSYVRGIEARTLRGAELVEVFVAKDLIPSGTAGQVAINDGLIEKQTVPRKALAEGSISSLKEIENRVAAVDIFKGEQINQARFVRPAEARGLIPIPADRQAMSIEVDMPPGVAGFVQSGDQVSIIAQLEEPEPRAEYLLQNVQVLAVGQRVVTIDGNKDAGQVQQTQERVLLTLAVTPAEAEKLAFAMFQGQIHVTLLPTGQQPSSTSGSTSGNVFS